MDVATRAALPFGGHLSFEAALASFIVKLTEVINAGRSEGLTCTVKADPGGKKFIRIVKVDPGSMGGSAYCFIGVADGGIYKPAGFKGPAPTARGNIYNENQTQGCGPYGVAYLK